MKISAKRKILWDAGIAANLVDSLKQKPQQTVVVLAGTSHSWKHGIPEQLASLCFQLFMGVS